MNKMLKLCIVVLLFNSDGFSQNTYAKLRAGFVLEGFGFSPISMLSAEMPFIYGKNGFWNLQAGAGIVGHFSDEDAGPSMSVATSYNRILNPYHKKQCNPWEEPKRVESYLEVGLAASFFKHSRQGIPKGFKREGEFSPLGLVGIRFHFVGARWIYIVKARVTPIINNKLYTRLGVGVGLGWK